MAHYELGEFAAAVDEFKLAYARSQAPGLLFNLAQASRLNKDYEQALHFYRAYLRVRPDAANRDDVERRITELEPIVEVRRKAEVEQLSAGSHAAVGADADHAGRRGARRRSASRRCRAGGRCASPASSSAWPAWPRSPPASASASRALDAQNKLSSLAVAHGQLDARRRRACTRSGQNDAAASTALYVVGGAAIATGVVLYAVGWRRDRARFAVAPAPGGGAQAVWSCAF